MADLEQRIKQILTEYAEDIQNNVDEIGKRLAKEGAKQINANASIFGGSKYRASWTSTEEKSRVGTSYTIHSNKPGLPHLLEHGHASRRGGRFIAGRTHIAPVEEQLIDEYQKEVIDAIKQGR